jgi:hypothetical protein
MYRRLGRNVRAHLPSMVPVDGLSLLWPRAMKIQTAARYLDCSP